MSVTPQEIIQIAGKIKKGDREAFREIVEEYQGFVYNFSLRLTNNRESAYDLTSEVFLRVFIQLPKYKPEFPFKSWLGRVTYTTGLNFLRQKRETIHIEELQEDVPFQVPDGSPTPEDEVVTKSIKDAVATAIEKLKPAFRAIITLCDIQGISYDDVASILKIPTGTVRSRLSRARQSLKDAIDGTI